MPCKKLCHLKYLVWNIYLVLLAHVSPAQYQAETFPFDNICNVKIYFSQ